MTQPVNLKQKISDLEKTLDNTAKGVYEVDKKQESTKAELKEIKKDLSNLTNSFTKLISLTVGSLEEPPVPAPKQK